MDIVKGKAALKALAARPARRTCAQNRDFVLGRLPEMREARGAGYGFESIGKTLLKGEGVRIAASTLQWHYLALEKSNVVQEKPTQIIRPEQETPVLREEAPADDGYGFVVGDAYELQNVEGDRQIRRTVQYDGFRDGKYVFLQISQARTFEKGLSPVALKHYTVIRK